MQKMSRIYHGCFRKNQDGTNRIIAKNERCLIATLRPFWKYNVLLNSFVKRK